MKKILNSLYLIYKSILSHKNKLVTLLIFLTSSMLMNGQSTVTIEEKPLIIPTYQVGPPDKNPIFFSGRNYQGAQGHVYPLPMYDVLTGVLKDQTYKAVYLENEYVKLCILPQLGGRIFSALDKTDQYDFFYHQHVIKPALIGMTGAWISGGVEWNIPDHHRATSQLPIDYRMVENPDGSKTTWVGETELSRGLKWSVGMTVYPGKSYVEATVKVFNPTPFIHSFLYWANVSVHCNENYQVIFPPSTQFGAQHAKGEFTSWPTGKGFYGGIDRTGVDLSWWKNHPNPASIFAWNFTDDFLAGYDFGKDAGTVHVANHQVVTGKKFFLWGNNAEAKMWEKMLTESDGQYLELMVGTYSDNQPDYSWIAPGETRIFKQYWYPIKKIGGVKNANSDAAVNLERKTPGSILVGFNTTAVFNKSKVVVTVKNKNLSEEIIDIDPGKPYLKEFPVDTTLKDTDIKVSLFNSDGHELVSYSPVNREKEERPKPVEKPYQPKEYNSNEELYLTGLRIEQFRNALIDPMPYYQEALNRDSLDYRVNTVLGIRYCKEGAFAEAEKYLRKAIKRSSKDYTRPKDGEAYYYLGIVLQFAHRYNEASDALWKATWYSGFQSQAYFRLAQIACQENKYAEALEMADQSLTNNSANPSTLALKAYVLRKTGNYVKARETLKYNQSIDKLDNWNSSEGYFLDAVESGKKGWSDANINLFKVHEGGNVQYALELVKNYGNIGAYNEALYILNLFKKVGSQNEFPLLSYYAGYYLGKSGSSEASRKFLEEAAAETSDYCFPWRLEEIDILESAIKENPSDARALYYLGNLHYFLNQKEKAISEWEQSARLDDKFYHVYRSLGFASEQVSHDLKKGIGYYEKAIEINSTDPRLYAELDVLRERAGISPVERLSFLEKNKAILEKRDDAITHIIQLYNLTGAYDKSLQILTNRQFHVWEGGGNIHDIFVDANLLRGISELGKKQYTSALKAFQLAATYPDNLEVGEPFNNVERTRIDYYIALAFSGLKNETAAGDYLNKAAQHRDNGNLGELDFYKAMALRKLGKDGEADVIFHQIEKHADEGLKTSEETDFFAKFGNDTRQESRKAYNYYLLGLSFLGTGNTQKANESFQKSVDLDHNQLWASFMLQLKNQNAVVMKSKR